MFADLLAREFVGDQPVGDWLQSVGAIGLLLSGAGACDFLGIYGWHADCYIGSMSMPFRQVSLPAAEPSPHPSFLGDAFCTEVSFEIFDPPKH